MKTVHKTSNGGQPLETQATGRTCALESCNKPSRAGSRHCSYGHNVATANEGGVR